MCRGETGVHDVATDELDGTGGATVDEDDVGVGDGDGATEDEDDGVGDGVTELDDGVVLVWLLVSEIV
jgi:hypothetical protein